MDLRRIFRRKDGGRDKADVGSRSGGLPRQNSEFRNPMSARVVAGFPVQISEFRRQRSEVKTCRAGACSRRENGGWLTKLFPSVQNVKIRRNQRRGGSPCPPEGSWFVKLFPAVQILKKQNRRNVCPYRTGFTAGASPRPTAAGILFSAQPGRVSLSDYARAGTETRPYGCMDLFSSQPGCVSASGCVAAGASPRPTVLTSDF